MIDRQAIACQIREWAGELTGLGFHRTDMQFWEEGAMPEPLRQLTARGTPTRTRRKPDPRIRSLTPQAQRCDEILAAVEDVDHRYRRALVLYSCVHPISRAAGEMRRNLVDFARFAEGGFAIYAVYDRRALIRSSASSSL